MPPNEPIKLCVSTHSHPKVAAGTIIQFASNALFQHTATRRWLQPSAETTDILMSFNTQPPEGGCIYELAKI